MPEKALRNVAAKHGLTVEQVAGILDLVDQGYSIPYIKRYHTELAAGLDASRFHELIEERKRLENLESRRQKIIKKLQERDILTESLAQKIHQAHDMRELIDYYVPFRPRKRSLSRQALAQGLAEPARRVLAQEAFIGDMAAFAEPYVDAEKGLDNVELVLAGIYHIITDWVAEEKSHRDRQRKVVAEQTEIVCTRTGRGASARIARDYRAYFDYRARVSDQHAYHALNILRGKRLRILQYHLEPPLEAMGRVAAELYLPSGAPQYEQAILGLAPEALAGQPEELKKLNGVEFMAVCLKSSLDNILSGIAVRELEKQLIRDAEDVALAIIRRDVRALLMARPLKKRILGIHPGYRTGCNMAVVDENGNLLETATVYPHAPQNETDRAREEIIRLVETHKVEAAVIGKGTAAQETEALIVELIAGGLSDLHYTIVPQVGIEAYSESRSARNELPDVDARERCAVALCRRVNDPLSELIKINPRKLCPEPYVDDANGGALKKLLEGLIEECVCDVGVDVNTAHFSLLRYVAGIGPEAALEIVAYREKNGPFASREQLRLVPKFNRDNYERAIGFLRVPASEHPLDTTRVHPRFYPIVEAICRQLDITLADLATEKGRNVVREGRAGVKLAELEKEFGVHYLMLREMLDEMAEPWPDPRLKNPGPVLRQRDLTLDSIEPGQWLTGTVRNVVDFGVFVDIGVREDGLVHISELSDKYIESPYDVVSVGNTVRVRVVRIDRDKGRIALSMRSKDSVRSPAARPPRRSQSRPRRRQEHQPAAAQTGQSRPAPEHVNVRASLSTRGSESRRVKRANLTEHLARNENKPISRTKDKPTRQEQASEEDKGKKKPKVDLGNLLQRLDFASLERRGKQRPQ